MIIYSKPYSIYVRGTVNYRQPLKAYRLRSAKPSTESSRVFGVLLQSIWGEHGLVGHPCTCKENQIAKHCSERYLFFEGGGHVYLRAIVL